MVFGFKKKEKKFDRSTLGEDRLKSILRSKQYDIRKRKTLSKIEEIEKSEKRRAFLERQPRLLRKVITYQSRKVGGVPLRIAARRLILKNQRRRASAPRGYSVRRGRVGRPQGPSGRYIIQGRPVGVFEYRRYITRVNALRRLQSGMSGPEINQPVYDGMDEQYEFPQEQMASTNNFPIKRMSLPLPPQMINQDYNRIQNPSQSDNILNAPNIFKGELRNTGQNSAIRNADEYEKPITNPTGDYYTEVDPLSGKSILRRRPREKWINGG